MAVAAEIGPGASGGGEGMGGFRLTKDCGVHPKVPNRAIYTGISRKIIGFRGPGKASRYFYMLRKAPLGEGRDVRFCQVEAGAAPVCR
jgi:hypothetical protein